MPEDMAQTLPVTHGDCCTSSLCDIILITCYIDYLSYISVIMGQKLASEQKKRELEHFSKGAAAANKQTGKSSGAISREPSGELGIY